MQGEVQVCSQRDAWRRFEIHDKYIRVDRAGRLDDIRIQLAGIPSDCAVLHEESAIEIYRVLMTPADRNSCRFEIAGSQSNALRYLSGQTFHVLLRRRKLAAVRLIARPAAHHQ